MGLMMGQFVFSQEFEPNRDEMAADEISSRV